MFDSRRQTDRPRTRAFTLTELMVSVAILVLIMLAVSYIFSAASSATGVATAAIELSDVVETMRRTMQTDLDTMAPGLLIIDSPDPCMVLPFPNNMVPDATGEPKPSTYDPNYALRRDRMVFLSATSPRTYESSRYAGVTSGEAMICYGHAGYFPPGLTTPIQDPIQLAPTAFDRLLMRRAILLGAPLPAFPIRPLGLSDGYFQAVSRIILCAEDAVQETLSDLTTRLRRPDYAPTSTLRWTYVRSYSLKSLDDIHRTWLAPAMANFDADLEAQWYVSLQHCFDFVPHVGHFMIEWSDGALGVLGEILWYGLPRDINGNGTVAPQADANDIPDTWPKSELVDHWPPDDASGIALSNGFEENPGVTSPPDYPGYRAVWRVDNGTWNLRPKMLRVTVRIYDENKRMRDADERLGQKRSFVLQVP
ncbi:MAG: prepilin-type N-terminal cleavage/methylation domain-containing protein [Phycisphaerae bacterium]|nr:prepilin-type N-terminal cleavage/methylation domain-containing protein [Phycisphaerae bacterium]